MKDLEVKVRRLSIEGTENLTKDNFKGLEHFQHLTISYFVNFSHADLLENLPNLTLFRLEDTKSKDIPNNFFRFSSKLKTLDIFYGGKSKLRKEQFYGLNNLSHLKLNIFDIYDVDEDFSFDGLTSLESLYISHQTLNKLPPLSLRNLLNLESIVVCCVDGTSYSQWIDNNVDDSKLVMLSEKLFANIRSLKALSIESIGTKDLPKNIFHNNFGTLENLSISEYLTDTLPQGIFNNVQNVTELRIINSNLKFLSFYIFINLKKLESLDLSNNKLTILDL